MLNVNPTSLRLSLGDAAAAGGSGPSTATDPAGFASLLRQTQVTSAPPPALAPAPEPVPTASADEQPVDPPPPSDEAPEDPAAPPDSDPASRTRALLRGKLRAADGTTVSPRDAKPAPDARDTTGSEPVDAAGDAKTAKTKPTAAATPIDPSVMHWLAGLQRAAAGEPETAKPGTDDKALSGNADAAVTDARGATADPRAAELKADAELKDKVALGKSQLADAASASQFAGALAEQRTSEKQVSPVLGAAGGTKDIAAVAAGALQAAPTPGVDAPAPVAVPIATPVDAPDFAQALGLRLAVLAKDGVQTAELHLNPAEMGPVSVQIVMDGTQARVDFGADMAATRQAIEAGLPELASALRDAGFTLAGGGVSQHGGGRQGGGDPGSPNGRRERGILVENDVNRVATAARRVVTKGGVDVFA